MKVFLRLSRSTPNLSLNRYASIEGGILFIWLLSLVLFGSCAVYVLIAFRTDPLERHRTLVSLAVAGAGTVSGVLLAFDLQDRLNRDSERKTYAALTASALSELRSKSSETRRTLAVVRPATDGFTDMVLSGRPASAIVLIATLISSESFHKHTTPSVLAALVQLKEDSEGVAVLVNDKAAPGPARKESLAVFIAVLEFGRQVLELQQELLTYPSKFTEIEARAADVLTRRVQSGNAAFLPADVEPPR